MTDAAYITDEELTAYLDGEASDALQTRIEAAMQVDHDLKNRLSALTLDIAILQQEVLSSYPAAPAMPVLPPQRPSSRSGRIFASGIAVGATIGVLIFATLLSRPQPTEEGWASFVASYQMLYTAETLNRANPSSSDTSAQLRHVSDAVGLDLNALPDIAGLTFKRAQVLGFRGAPLIQIAYQRPDGTPVALCIIQSDPQPTDTMAEGESKGLQTVRWTQDGHGFLLIGDMDPKPLREAAEIFAATL